MKVYTDAPIGTILKFKLESSPPDQFGKEQDAITTVSGEWATYTWDLSNADNPIYDVLTLMLGYNGSNDASANATFLFDDIEIISNVLSNGIDQSFNTDKVNASPNPTKDLVTITSKNKSINSITFHNILGKEILKLQPNNLSTDIDISNFAKGLYIVKVSTSSGIGSIKLLKE
jgi:hypothetical protein